MTRRFLLFLRAAGAGYTVSRYRRFVLARQRFAAFARRAPRSRSHSRNLRVLDDVTGWGALCVRPYEAARQGTSEGRIPPENEGDRKPAPTKG